MPIRTATLRHKIEQNGARLHAAMLMRTASRGADAPPTEEEQALLDERRALKEARAQRQVQAKLPRVKVAKAMLHHPAHPKAPKAPKLVKEHDKAKDDKHDKNAKKPHLTRTELHAKKAEALKAAEQAAKKAAAAKKAEKGKH